MATRRRLQIGVVATALLAVWLPLPAPLVERWYATSTYPLLQRAITPVTNLVPFAMLDLLVLGAAAALVFLVWRCVQQARRRRTLRPLLSAGVAIAVAGATVYIAFLLVWGLNYQRIAMSDRLVVDPDPPVIGDVVALGLQAVARMNELHAAAHASGWDDPWRNRDLISAFGDTQAMLSDAAPAHAGRLKWSLFGVYFRWASIDGMIHPFALEVIANPDLLPWERPFVAAHEWAHLAGYAHETEANFVGWLTCVRGDAGAQYSGWLHLYWQVAGDVRDEDRQRLDAALAPGPRADIDAIFERIRQGRFPFLQDASWRVYDHYLRAHRVEGGVRSYGEVVNLILRSRFEDNWRPVRRTAGSRPALPAADRTLQPGP